MLHVYRIFFKDFNVTKFSHKKKKTLLVVTYLVFQFRKKFQNKAGCFLNSLYFSILLIALNNKSTYFFFDQRTIGSMQPDDMSKLYVGFIFQGLN